MMAATSIARKDLPNTVASTMKLGMLSSTSVSAHSVSKFMEQETPKSQKRRRLKQLQSADTLTAATMAYTTEVRIGTATHISQIKMVRPIYTISTATGNWTAQNRMEQAITTREDTSTTAMTTGPIPLMPKMSSGPPETLSTLSTQ